MSTRDGWRGRWPAGFAVSSAFESNAHRSGLSSNNHEPRSTLLREPHPLLQLWHDRDNLEGTVRWLRTHNALAMAMSASEAEAWLLDLVRDGSRGTYPEQVDRLQSGYGVHWCIDQAAWQRSAGTPDYQVNFFIRPGRPPALAVASE